MTQDENRSKTSQERAEALSERIARLTALVASRSDETSRQLRNHLDLLANTLEQKARALPRTEAPHEGEMVLSMPPALDVIEALVTGRPVGEGGTHPATLAGLEDADLQSVAREATLLAVATEDLFEPKVAAAEPAPLGVDAAAPEDVAAEATTEEAPPDLAAADPRTPTVVEAAPTPEAEVSPDSEPSSEAAAAEATAPSESMAASEEAEAQIPAPTPSEEAPSDSMAASEELTSESETETASPSDEGIAAELEALAGLPSEAPTQAMTVPPSPPPVPEETSKHEWQPVTLRDEEEVGASVDLTQEREVPRGVLEALSLDEEGDTAESKDLLRHQPSDEVDDFDEPHAHAALVPEGSEDLIPVQTNDVEIAAEADLLDAARGEARHMLASLGAPPDQGFDELEPIEPLERLASHPPASARPHPRAVAAVPRQLAYEALAAPMRIDGDGTLACLVPDDYEPERLDHLAATLERRVVAVKAPHDEVIEALEAAYGPVAGVDKDALLIAISDDSSSANGGLMGRVSRWLRNT